MSSKKVIKNTDPLDGEVFEIQSSAGSLKLPSLTTTEINNIAGGSPRAGIIVHDSDTDEFKGSLNAGTFSPFGGSGGSGSGAKNYFTNENFDNLSNVTAYDDTGAYVDGTGGTASVVTGSSETGGDVLAGTTTLIFNKQVGDASGEGLTLTTTDIDRIDQGSILYGSFSIDATQANYPSGDIELFAYDVANSEILHVELDGFEDKTIPAIKGKLRFKVFTTENTTGAVRISFHIETDNQTGTFYEVFIDEFVLGPQRQVTVTPRFSSIDAGAMTIEATTTDPTKGSTVDDDKVTYARDGEYAIITYYYYQASGSGGAAGSGDYLFKLPAGLQMDTSHPSYKASTDGDTYGTGTDIGGGYLASTSGAGAEWNCRAIIYDSTHFRLTSFSSSSDHRQQDWVGSSLYALNESNVTYNVTIKVPIAGWQSNAVLGANQRTIRMSEINLTEVSSTPTKFGEYQPLEKVVSSQTYADGATPTDPPSKADGFRIDTVNGTNASTSGRPMAYVINIGKNRHWALEWYSSTGLTGILNTDQWWDSSSSISWGINTHYEKSTGNLFVYAPLLNGSSTRYVGLSRADYTGAVSNVQTGYFDIIVAEDPGQLFLEQAKSEVWVTNGNGRGSTDTFVRRYTNTQTNTGSAITYTDSATAGATFTINEPGLYSISQTHNNDGIDTIGISLNASSGATALLSLTESEVLAADLQGAADQPVSNAVTLRLSVGDVIRSHTNDGGGRADGTNAVAQSFRVTKIGP